MCVSSERRRERERERERDRVKGTETELCRCDVTDIVKKEVGH